MILFYRHEKVFFLGLCFFFSTIGMNDKSPREIVNPTPGCIRQNSQNLLQEILAITKDNPALQKELKALEEKFEKAKSNN